ncbi:hypothetical protein [Gilliamella sp. Pas-s25]|uniref:hypothetical protein n=1 Tax=Gilliamella sp. Pas-s25 TaxID=2687310 RepID=UPI00135DE5C1|nr:hypothetical protein [Gilliamella sp. Pas-s25]MWP62869.1 hypothetical protein [Gilliamella sp. Pas-s25]
MTVYFAEWNADYEKYMVNVLKSEYDVVLLNQLMKHFRDINFFLARKNFPRKWFIKLHQFMKLRTLKADDILLCSGFAISGFIDLVKNLQCHKVLVLRDTVEVLNNSMKNKKKWLCQHEDYINKIIPFFDKIYSFDFDDCRKYNFTYLNQFLPFTFPEMKKLRAESNRFCNTIKTCFFIGEYLENRVEVINKIAPILQQNGYQTDFNLINYTSTQMTYPFGQSDYFKSGEKISYFDNIDKVKDCDIILEVGKIGQSGVTLRAIEAILFNKKLITTNKSIKEYDFYSSDQIFVLDGENYQNIESFLKSRFSSVTLDTLYQYSPNAMLDSIICDVL